VERDIVLLSQNGGT